MCTVPQGPRLQGEGSHTGLGGQAPVELIGSCGWPPRSTCSGEWVASIGSGIRWSPGPPRTPRELRPPPFAHPVHRRACTPLEHLGRQGRGWGSPTGYLQHIAAGHTRSRVVDSLQDGRGDATKCAAVDDVAQPPQLVALGLHAAQVGCLERFLVLMAERLAEPPAAGARRGCLPAMRPRDSYPSRHTNRASFALPQEVRLAQRSRGLGLRHRRA